MLARRIYSAFTYTASPFLVARLLLKSRKNPAYREEIPQRFGFCGKLEEVGCRVWIHCVSVGETIAAAGLVRALQREDSIDRILISSTTPTGAAQVFHLFGNSVERVYLPFDTPGAVSRFLDRVRPNLAVLMETEMWPNLIHACWSRDIPTVLANARLSERSAKRYARLSNFSRIMVREIDVILAQNSQDAQRYIDLGADATRVSVSGSIKFDISLDEDLQRRARDYRECWGENRPVWIAASTHQGEESILLEAHKQVLKTVPEALLVIVPRHQERFTQVSELVHTSGVETIRQSQVKGHISATAPVVVADLLGELLAMLGAADAAFVGGSLVKRGGHNLIEPAVWTLPILTGESNYNFMDISERLKAAGGLSMVKDAESLAQRVTFLLQNPKLRLQMGVAARRVVEEQRGATRIHLDQIKELI